jgi:metal-sulfur cluster biosynthetic enzyme
MSKPTAAARGTEVAVWDAPQTVVDPELSTSLVDLAMIRAVTVDGASATVELALTAPSYPLADWLAEQVWQTVPQIPSIQTVYALWTHRDSRRARRGSSGST